MSDAKVPGNRPAAELADGESLHRLHGLVDTVIGPYETVLYRHRREPVTLFATRKGGDLLMVNLIDFAHQPSQETLLTAGNSASFRRGTLIEGWETGQEPYVPDPRGSGGRGPFTAEAGRLQRYLRMAPTDEFQLVEGTMLQDKILAFPGGRTKAEAEARQEMAAASLLAGKVDQVLADRLFGTGSLPDGSRAWVVRLPDTGTRILGILEQGSPHVELYAAQGKNFRHTFTEEPGPMLIEDREASADHLADVLAERKQTWDSIESSLAVETAQWINSLDIRLESQPPHDGAPKAG